MFEKNMRIAYILDFYAEVLDPHIRNVMRAYYDDDLSLSEIAAGEGISRQGIRHLIKKGEDQIEYLESNLSLAKRHEELMSACESLCEIRDKLKDSVSFANDADAIDRVIEVITKGNQDVPKFN